MLSRPASSIPPAEAQPSAPRKPYAATGPNVRFGLRTPLAAVRSNDLFGNHCRAGRGAAQGRAPTA